MRADESCSLVGRIDSLVSVTSVHPCIPVVPGSWQTSATLLEFKGWARTSQAGAQGGGRDISDADELVACFRSPDDG
jgi:hypothetical protein